MDNFDLMNFDENRFKGQDKQKKEPETIPFDDSDSKASTGGVKNSSAKPTGEVKKPVIVPGQKPKPSPAKITPTRPAANTARPAAGQSTAGKRVLPPKITGVKTFFTKLHIGSIDYLDEQIADWLKANPHIRIKHTNTVCGMVVSKTTEPNLIITVWY